MTMSPLAPTLRPLMTLSFAILLLVAASGCSWFGPSESQQAISPCANIANQYTSASASACEVDPRGEWIEGRCYCHSAAEDANR